MATLIDYDPAQYADDLLVLSSGDGEPPASPERSRR